MVNDPVYWEISNMDICFVVKILCKLMIYIFIGYIIVVFNLGVMITWDGKTLSL